MLAIARNTVILFSAGLIMILVLGCGVSTEDIDATIEARIASIPTPTPQIVIVEVEKEVVKVVKEVEVEDSQYDEAIAIRNEGYQINLLADKASMDNDRDTAIEKYTIALQKYEAASSIDSEVVTVEYLLNSYLFRVASYLDRFKNASPADKDVEDIKKAIADLDEVLRLDPELTNIASTGATAKDVLRMRASAIGILENEYGIMSMSITTTQEIVTVEVIKEIEVEKIVEVVVTATPIPEPTVAQGKVYEWDDISLEYENNGLVANSKYLNKAISIRGEIYKIDYSYFSSSLGVAEDIPTVWLTDGVGGRLLCGLDSLDKVGNLSVDDTVVVNGTIVKWDGTGWLYVYPCSIVD